MAQRLFLALWPGDDVRRQLAGWRDAWTWPSSATPVPDDKLHLTLHFLGDVDDARAAQLAAASPVASGAVELHFGTAAIWHNGIAVLEPLAPPQALFDLHAALGRQLLDIGLVPEARPYRPHVTMARRAGNAHSPAAPSLTWRADEYALVASSNGVYTPLQRFRCSGAD